MNFKGTVSKVEWVNPHVWIHVNVKRPDGSVEAWAVEGGTPQEINVGDVVHIKAGERHWHGAKADSTMGHITITAVGGQAKWG